MSHPLKGKRALVTGGSRGIGAAIVKRLAREGADVALTYVSKPDGAGKTADAAKAFGVRALAIQADAADPEAIVAAVERTAKEFGGIDILVNNAGIQFVAPVDEFPVDKWNTIIALNLSAAFHTVRLALPKMKEKKWGRIIQIASAHALVASPYKSAYVAAKHGIAGFTKTVALEVAEQGITANAICPGYVWTPLVEKQIPETAKARGITEQQVISDVLLAAQPTKQFVQVDEVAALAVFLASDEAASITGAIMPVDGGWTSH